MFGITPNGNDFSDDHNHHAASGGRLPDLGVKIAVSHLPRIIADRAKSKMLNRQPSTMFDLLLALRPEQTWEKWPLTPVELATIFGDLGQSLSA